RIQAEFRRGGMAELLARCSISCARGGLQHSFVRVDVQRDMRRVMRIDSYPHGGTRLKARHIQPRNRRPRLGFVPGTVRALDLQDEVDNGVETERPSGIRNPYNDRLRRLAGGLKSARIGDSSLPIDVAGNAPRGCGNYEQEECDATPTVVHTVESPP